MLLILPEESAATYFILELMAKPSCPEDEELAVTPPAG